MNEIDEFKEDDDDDSNLLFGKFEFCFVLIVRGDGIDLELMFKF